MVAIDKEQVILDATCGGRTIWHDANKDRDDTLYIDRREEPPGFHGQEGRTYAVQPDEVQDFRDLPYEDESFKLIVWDPPHIKKKDGMQKLSGVVPKKYGALHAETWQGDLKQGFRELWRVLDVNGVLVFKFCDVDVEHEKVLNLFPKDPLFGTVSKKRNNHDTRWFVFMKREENGLKSGAEGER